jgi:hypothetical protein
MLCTIAHCAWKCVIHVTNRRTGADIPWIGVTVTAMDEPWRSHNQTCKSSELLFPLEAASLQMTKTREEASVRSFPATEYLFLENIALKLVLDPLDHREVPNWQKLLDHLLTDQEMLAGVPHKFSDLYREIDKSSDPSVALEAFLGDPVPRKAH